MCPMSELEEQGLTGMMAEIRLQVEVDEDTVRISYLFGPMQEEIEIVMWTKDEWVENPDIVPVIVNAVCMAFRNPVKLGIINMDHMIPQLNEAYFEGRL
jgi:hypothetical protein